LYYLIEVALQICQECLENLAEHRLLGLEVMVKAPRQDAGGIGDVAHCRLRVSARSKQFSSNGQQLRPTPRSPIISCSLSIVAVLCRSHPISLLAGVVAQRHTHTHPRNSR